MKKAISFSPTFNPTAKTLDFTALAGGFALDKLYAVIDVTQNQIIYAVGQPAYGYAGLTGSVLTLAYNTAAFSSSDILLVLYDTTDSFNLNDGSGNPISSTSGALNISGTITATDAANGLTGSAVPTYAAQVGGVDGSGLLRALSVSSAGVLALPTGASTSALQTTGNTTLASILTALGTPAQAGGSVSVSNFPATQPVSATALPLPSGAATSALQTTGNTSLASILANQTNSTQKTQVVDGTGAVQGPAVAISGTNYMPVTLASSATPGSPIVSRAVQVAGSDGTNARILATDTLGRLQTVEASDVAPATQTITAQDTGTTATAGANSQNFYTGTPTAGSAAVFSLSSAEAVEIMVTGTWTGTMQTEISMDGGVTWFTRGIKQSGASYISSALTGNFQGGMSVTGMTNVRVRSTTTMTGTATVKVIESANTASITVTNPLTLRDATTQSVTSAIKAASTAPLGTDNALVVALSPNGNQGTAANQATMISSLAAIAANTGASLADFTNTGTIAALNGTVVITGQGVYTVTASITGTWVGTLVFEGQTPDLNWYQIPANLVSATLPYTSVASTTTNGLFAITGGGFLNIRVRASAYTSGTVAVALDGSLSQQTILANQIGSWTSTISDPTTPANKANVTSSPAARGSLGIVTIPAPQALIRTTFSSVIASGVDPNGLFTLISTGTGQSVSQTGGNLVLTTGTTANSETIIRSNSSFSGAFIARVQNILSQRIANQNFFVELVDVIGDGLTASATSATVLNVTIPNNPFTSVNVGQSMYIGNFTGGLTGVPGRYAISSVAGNVVTFTVAGFSVTSGTVSLFGWNYHQQQFTSTTATSVNYDTQRNGWNSGFTAATINTTASPGTMTIMTQNDGNAYLADQLIASSAAVQTTLRASRVINNANESAKLFLQIRSLNGSTAPASTTTWTVGMVSVENYSPVSTVVNEVKPQGAGNQLPVAVTNTPAVTVSSGTVTTVSTVSTVSSVTGVTSVTNSYNGKPATVADVASAAITTTTITANITPGGGNAYQVNIPVTAMSGTNPTMDVVIQESRDAGFSWVNVYQFPRITAIGPNNSPLLPLTGTLIRYVQTIGGTTPSFTRAINRLQDSMDVGVLRQLIDRNIVLTTTFSATASLPAEQNTKNVQLVVNIGAATTPPVLQIQGSEDGGITWYNVGATLTTVANSTVSLTVNNVTAQLFQAIVSTAGAGVTLGYALLRAF